MLSNPRSDRVMAVARLSGRSARQRAGRFLVEGPQAVREAVALALEPIPGVSGGTLREVYATDEAAQRHPDIVAGAASAGVAVHPATDEVFAALVAGAGTLSPQGLLAVCDLIGADLVDVVAARPRLVAVLSQVRDPGNAGTVIRVADAAGADAVVLAGASVDVHNPKTVRASVGSVFHLPVVTGVTLEAAVGALRAAGLTILAADGAGDVDLDDLDLESGTWSPGAAEAALGGDVPSSMGGSVGWIFGNEAWGLPAEDRALADAVVRVPIYGRAESLNLATAAAVCLYATARAQRRRR